jgi:predicted molibdopterin-dependent oxidoreductase YjgC
MRITGHPILEDLKGRKKVVITVDSKQVEAYEGEPIAAALYAAGIKVFRTTRKYKEPRGVFCNRGRCTDCIMKVDGKPNVRTCITMVKEGMKIESISGLGNWGFKDK